MAHDYDVVVVGARSSGAAVALLLARRGHRVLMVDKDHLPANVPRGHFVHRHGPGALARWGLLDAVLEAGCPPITSLTLDLGDFPLTIRNLECGGVAWGYGPRRRVLDQILVQAAIRSGADLWDEFCVDHVLGDSDGAKGVRGRQRRNHEPVDVYAKLTIGADGLHSVVARSVRAPVLRSTQALTCWYFSYFAEVANPQMAIHVLPQRRALFAFPTTDNLFAIFVGWPAEEFRSVRSDINQSFLRVLELVPDLAARVHAGRRAERFYGTVDLPNLLRKGIGPGWALVGDASCHKDPFQALGISDAFRDAEQLAQAAHELLSDQDGESNALGAYEAARLVATLPDFESNIRAARFEPLTEEVRQLRLVLRNDAHAATQFFMERNHMRPRTNVFHLADRERLLGGTRET